MSAVTDFFDKMLPYANRASSATSIPTSVILAQWGIESGYGTSKGAKVRNNFGGLSWMSSKMPDWTNATGLDPRPKNEGGYYFTYANASDYTDDYIHYMQGSRYASVRKAGKEGNITQIVNALSKSGYAASGYGGGNPILSAINKYKLTSYDNKKYFMGGSIVDSTKSTTTSNTFSLEGITDKLKGLESANTGEIAKIGTIVLLIAMVLSNIFTKKMSNPV